MSRAMQSTFDVLVQPWLDPERQQCLHGFGGRVEIERQLRNKEAECERIQTTVLELRHKVELPPTAATLLNCCGIFMLHVCCMLHVLCTLLHVVWIVHVTRCMYVHVASTLHVACMSVAYLADRGP